MLKEIKSTLSVKTRTLISLILILLTVSAFIYNRASIETVVPPPQSLPAPDPVTGLPNQFLIGVFNGGYMPTWNQFQELNMNIWHHYPNNVTSIQNDQGWTRHIAQDLLGNDISMYRTRVQQLLDTNQDNNLYTLMNRVKIDQLGYGSRSDYQCESRSNILNNDLDFYCYQQSETGTDYLSDPPYGQDIRGKYCGYVNQTNMGSGWMNQGYVVKTLYTNREQADMNSIYWIADKIHKFLIKPSIRIDPNISNDKKVCRVEIWSWDNVKLRETDIYASNFRDAQHPYTGQYIENYFGLQEPWDLKFGYPNQRGTEPGDEINPDHIAPGDWTQQCNIDFRVWWYGECEMWIDYVRVDNDKADELFKGEHDDWLQQEAQQLACYNNSPIKFYLEEWEFNHLPCLAYVSRKLKEYSQPYGRNINLAVALNYAYMIYLIPDKWNYPPSPHGKYGWDFVLRYLVDSLQLTQLILTDYPLNGSGSSSGYGNQPLPIVSHIPETLPVTNGTRIMADPLPIAEYENWLQKDFDRTFEQYRDSYTCLAKMSDYISKQRGIPYIHMLQAHVLDWGPGKLKSREPTNEEIKMMANVAVSYGAKGIMYFDYLSYGCEAGTGVWGAGLVNVDPNFDCNNAFYLNYNVVPRHDNVYKQYTLGMPPSDKYGTIASMNEKLKKWGTYLMSFDNDNRHSYVYRLESERTQMSADQSYIHALRTYKPGNEQLDCSQDNMGFQDPDGMVFDCPDSTYLQVATFSNGGQNTNYFMVVNRRCSPYIDENNENDRGGERDVRILFYQNDSHFIGPQDWEIVDLYNNSIVATFDKSVYAMQELGKFKPGEGKLYKIVPVTQEGGTLVSDENISNVNLTCMGNVYNNGYNITIGSGTTIHFTDSSTFIMNGGTIQIGDPNYVGTPNINLGAASGNHWNGLEFNNCTVKIYNTAFSGVSNDTSYAINTIDCPFVDIQKNTFSCDDNFKGAVNLTYYSIPKINNAYIGGNTVSLNSSAIPAFNILSYAGITVPLIVENNTLTSNSATGSTAIMLSGITGGAVKNNTITNYERSINALSSSLDISGNTVTSDVSSSKSISGLSGTVLKMNNSGDLFLGGQNTFTNAGNSSMNLYVEDSYFLIDNGENIFDITDGLPSYHLNGYFPVSDSIVTDARLNCFNINYSPSTPPVQDVTWGAGGDEVVFTFEPYLTGCSTDGGGDFVIYLGGGINDTISQRTGGGGESSAMVLTPKALYDSICIQMRFRNYGYVKNRCMDLINAYPDSIQSLNAIPKLYLSSTSSDTSHSGISALKTYYETLILNNPNNTSLVNRCNYFVQKCKVRLRQYSSALAGFQQIINNNPYSYEALVAKWDYMATHLLDSLSGGGEPGDGEGPHDKFTREQRKTINTSIGTALLDSKIKEEKKIEILSVLANTGNSLAAAELKVKKTLKEVSKPQSPHTIIEHIKIVNNDIQKVFGNPNRKSKNENNLIPTEFRLSQNYPNPFNPVTKIQYDLPKDVKVKLIIYDILGREVIRLVNNEFKQAGRYTVEFNGNNYASGVYFYRIEADKFVQSKKMVLVK
ncbi:MAG: T9SS type A sorting domain-containing protein [Ignavibacteria bacterium]|jgi:hypothetical protein